LNGGEKILRTLMPSVFCVTLPKKRLPPAHLNISLHNRLSPQAVSIATAPAPLQEEPAYSAQVEKPVSVTGMI
jgi:hypothetical protein